MNLGKTVFSQLMEFIPKTYFDKLVFQFKGNYKHRTFSCWDQYLCMAFAQLTYRESLRDIEACLRSNVAQLYHMGIKGNVSRTNLERANKTKDYRIFELLALNLIKHALSLFKKEDLIFNELNNALYALDSTVIDLCLSLFPWAKHRKHKSAIRINTLLDIRTSLPTFINISPGGIHEISSLDLIRIEPLAIYIMDKGFIDFERFNKLKSFNAYFITRAKKNQAYKRLYSQSVSDQLNVMSDQIIRMTGPKTSIYYPDKLRLIRYHDQINERYLRFITNNFNLAACTIAALFKERWKIELFFKWIKQNLRIKSFFSRNQNAIKSQIWIAISIYVLIIIIKKELNIQTNLQKILQVLSLNIFTKQMIIDLFINTDSQISIEADNNQLSLFDF